MRQQLLLQSDKLLRALRAELKVYEKLDQEQRRPRGTGHSGRACSPLHQQQAGPLSSNPRPASLVEQVDSEQALQPTLLLKRQQEAGKD